MTVEQNVLTVRAERAPVQADSAQMIGAERPSGAFTRQVFLGETLDAGHIAADCTAGVLTLTIPVREAAKPRSIQVTSRDQKQAVTAWLPPRHHRHGGAGQPAAPCCPDIPARDQNSRASTRTHQHCGHHGRGSSFAVLRTSPGGPAARGTIRCPAARMPAPGRP